ncbi:autotransporter outer membrane beta-barrel domain-containing protein, partial [Brucellaceae bacterium C25G]
VDPVDPVDPEIPDPLYQGGVPLYEAYPQFLLGLNALPSMQQRVGNRYWNNAGNRTLAQGADAVEAYVPTTESGASINGNGFWGRIEGGHSKMKPRVSTSSTRYDFNSLKLQAGLDGQLSETATGKLIGGVTGHYTHGKMDVVSHHGDGSIKTDGYGFGATLSWYGDNGFYVDGQGQVTWYRSELYSDIAKKNVSSDKNDGFGYSISAEAGQRITIDDHWSFTPQGQLQYSNVDFDDFVDVFDADVSRQKGESLRARLGVSVDYQNAWSNSKGLTNRSVVYGIANLYNEFLNGTKVRVSTADFVSKNEHFWGGIGFGGAYNWDDDKYSVYGEGSLNTSFKNFGDSYDFKGTLGLRVKW